MKPRQSDTNARSRRTGSAASNGRRPRRGGGRRPWGWQRVVAWVSIGAAVVLVGTCLTAYAAYRNLTGNISRTDVTEELGNHRPPKLNSSENILVLGSDSRAGLGNAYGANISGARSDTIILIHISPGGQQVTGISFPRDSVVNIPSCQVGKHKTDPAYNGMINSAFDEGPGCTWHALETLTGIHIDHFVDVDFSGFQRVTDALGGVRICLQQAVDDPKSGLDLSAGWHTVKGKEALAYVRERYDMGDGSDLDRIHRQQVFMSSIVSKLGSNGTLADPPKLYSTLSAITKAITVDKGFTIGEMEGLAGAMKGLSAGKVKFVTVPNELDPTDTARVVWLQPQAQQLFTSIREDNTIKATKTPKSTTAASKVPASQVKVQVLNGSTSQGLAAQVGDELKSNGFKVAKVGNASMAATASEILYGTGAQGAAQTLAAQVSGVTPQASSTVPAGQVELVLGSTWSGLKGKSGSTIPAGITAVTNKTNQCVS